MTLSEFVNTYGYYLLEMHRRHLHMEHNDFFCNQWDNIHWDWYIQPLLHRDRIDIINEELAHVPRYLRQVALLQLADIPLPRCPECGLVGYLFYTNKEEYHYDSFDSIDVSCIDPDSVYETEGHLEDNQLVYALCKNCSIMWEY